MSLFNVIAAQKSEVGHPYLHTLIAVCRYSGAPLNRHKSTLDLQWTLTKFPTIPPSNSVLQHPLLLHTMYRH